LLLTLQKNNTGQRTRIDSVKKKEAVRQIPDGFFVPAFLHPRSAREHFFPRMLRGAVALTAGQA
jgi:hypothetical protein